MSHRRTFRASDDCGEIEAGGLVVMRPDGTVAPPARYTGSEHRPPAAGWYAVGICWDPREGIYPGSDYWTGERWESGRPVHLWHGPHDSEHDARTYVDRWDPEDYAADAVR